MASQTRDAGECQLSYFATFVYFPVIVDRLSAGCLTSAGAAALASSVLLCPCLSGCPRLGIGGWMRRVERGPGRGLAQLRLPDTDPLQAAKLADSLLIVSLPCATLLASLRHCVVLSGQSAP